MVSVIIPTYNRSGTIERAIRSVLNQTYADLEVIVVDDCSTDNTAEIVHGINDDRITYVCLDSNQGACAARNAGIELAQGQYIAFQDSDDEWVVEKLERQIKIIEQTNADICIHRLRRHYPNDSKQVLFPEISESRFLTHDEMSLNAYISTQTIVGKRCVFNEHKFDPLVKKTQDYDWGIRASRNNKVYYCNESLVEQYYQGDSISAKGLRVVIETRQYFLEKYHDECVANPKFEIYQLQLIARCKSLLGENAVTEFTSIYRSRKAKGDLARLVLCKMGMMGLMYRLKGYKRENSITHKG